MDRTSTDNDDGDMMVLTFKIVFENG